MKSKSFIVKFVFQIHTNSGKIQFDEQWRIIFGENKFEAIDRAKTIGAEEEEIFVQIDGSEIKWEFVNITDVIPFDNVEDGHFIFSRTEEPDHVEHYLSSVRLKSKLHESTILPLQS